MAAGQGFKTFATGDVLSAADVNGYLMQGVLVFADATERNAEITSPQEGQFAYLKDTNVTTYYTGSAWANLDTTGMTNPMTTTGDTIYSSSGSTPARLGIGSTGQVLTVSGGVPTWATPSSGAPAFVGASVYRGSPDQSIATATWTAINWTAENYDTDAFHDNTTNNTRLTIPTGKGGYYQIRGQVGLQATSGEFNLRVQKNGTNVRYIIGSGASNDNSMQINFATSLAAGDYIELGVYQTSGSSKNVFAGALYCWFECNLLGA